MEEKKFVFRNFEDAPTYRVISEKSPAGYYINTTLFGNEANQNIVGEIVENSEENPNFHYVHRTTLPVGGEVPEHPHTGNEQFYLVLEGEGEVTLCGNKYPVKPMSIALIRNGGSHGIRNTSQKPLVYLCVETGLSGS